MYNQLNQLQLFPPVPPVHFKQRHKVQLGARNKLLLLAAASAITRKEEDDQKEIKKPPPNPFFLSLYRQQLLSQLGITCDYSIRTLGGQSRNRNSFSSSRMSLIAWRVYLLLLLLLRGYGSARIQTGKRWKDPWEKIKKNSATNRSLACILLLSTGVQKPNSNAISLRGQRKHLFRFKETEGRKRP